MIEIYIDETMSMIITVGIGILGILVGLMLLSKYTPFNPITITLEVIGLIVIFISVAFILYVIIKVIKTKILTI